MKLSNLAPTKGSTKRRKVLGRGNASGHGGTSTKGHKGQKARSGGGVRPGFEGGQMPLYRRIPKYGFRSKTKLWGHNSYTVVNVCDLNRFEDGAVVDIAALESMGLGCKSIDTVKIKVLGNGDLSKKLTVKAHAISESAKQKIEQAGGQVELLA